MSRDLEQELCDCQWIKDKVREDQQYATDLYRALCNIQWYTEIPEEALWHCSWRYAGGLVAGLRAQREDYLNFYCSGDEGKVTKEVERDLAKLGWKWQEWPDN